MGYFRTQSVPAIEPGKLTSYQRKLLGKCVIEEFTADATITLGQAVKLDYTELDTAIGSVTGIDSDTKANSVMTLSKKVIPTSAVAAGDPMFLGIACNAASAGETVYVVTKGLVAQVLIPADDVNDGEALVAADAATTTAGASETYAAGTHTATKPWGQAISTETSTAGFVGAVIY